MDVVKQAKPLNGKAYGHIPHLPGSRMGPADHHCHEGQARIATQCKRDKHDFITVTVKLDGSCVAVAKINGEIVSMTRAGYVARSSRFEQHHLFADWVESNKERFDLALNEGERIVGEWLAQAHGTRYELRHEPFAAFDIFRANTRILYEEMLSKANMFTTPQLLAVGPLSLEDAISKIQRPCHGEIDPVEGVVYRVERKGEFDFMCKWVDPNKVDGKYLPDVSGHDEVWNWRPEMSTIPRSMPR